MHTLFEHTMDTGSVARVLMTERVDGDLSSNQRPEIADQHRRALLDQPWSWLRQVHGNEVAVVTAPGDQAGATADAAVSAAQGVLLAVQVADCVPVALISDTVVAVAHAGWKGLAADVLGQTIEAARELGAGELRAVVGPSIGSACYEFGEPELTSLADQFGDAVRATTSTGTPAMNMAAGVAASLTAHGVAQIDWANPCTSCEADRFWSWRARAEPERQAMIVTVSPS